MRPLLLLAALLFVGGCALPPVTGRYAGRFSDADLREIRHLVYSQSYLKHDILSFSAIRPDAIFVVCGSRWYNGDSDAFIVLRRHGKWIIDEHSIQTIGRVISVS